MEGKSISFYKKLLENLDSREKYESNLQNEAVHLRGKICKLTTVAMRQNGIVSQLSCRYRLIQITGYFTRYIIMTLHANG